MRSKLHILNPSLAIIIFISSLIVEHFEYLYADRLAFGQAQQKTIESYSTNPPLAFVKNEGQFDNNIIYKVWGGDSNVYITKDAIWFTARSVLSSGNISAPYVMNKVQSFTEIQTQRSVAIKITFPDMLLNKKIEPLDQLATSFNYILGKNPQNWYINVPVFAGVRYIDVYPGIDFVITSKNKNLEWRLICNSNCSALPEVKIQIEGAEILKIINDHLLISTLIGDFKLPLMTVKGFGFSAFETPTIDSKPQYFEIINPFLSDSIEPSNTVTESVVDTTGSSDLIYSTFLGGNGHDWGNSIAVDDIGEVYVTGGTNNGDFPATPGIYDSTFNGGENDIFIAKLDKDGKSLIFATFVGGPGDEAGNSILVDESKNIFITGGTVGGDFPTTQGAFMEEGPSTNVFAVKLNSEGNDLIYSTLISGDHAEYGTSIALDDSGCMYIVGDTYSVGFPTTSDAFDTTFNGADRGESDAFVVKINPTGTDLIYGTYLGGWYLDSALGVAIDYDGKAYIIGGTSSPNFPTTPGAYDTTLNEYEVFLAILNVNGTGLDYATFFGGDHLDWGMDIVTDNNFVYLTGITESSNFPTTLDSFDTSLNNNEGIRDVFILKFNVSDYTIVFSSYLGGLGQEISTGIDLDLDHQIYLTGYTESHDFPITSGAFDTSYNGGMCSSPDTTPCSDTFIVKLNSLGSQLLYSTFMGSNDQDTGDDIVVNQKNYAYIVGRTMSSSFPISPGAYDTSFGGGLCGVPPNFYPCADVFIANLALPDQEVISYKIFLPKIFHGQ